MLVDPIPRDCTGCSHAIDLRNYWTLPRPYGGDPRFHSAHCLLAYLAANDLSLTPIAHVQGGASPALSITTTIAGAPKES